jgi:hypothetical protein
MNIVAKTLRSQFNYITKFGLSKNVWKDRDESAEKVYISQEESIILLI